MKRADAWWLLAVPLYQMVGTARHELSHAFAALFQGAKIVKVGLLPSIHPTNGFLWGYVRFAGGHPGWITMSAPYFCDLLVITAFVLLFPRVRLMPRWLRINGLILGIASPLIDLVYNYQKVFTRSHGDMNYLMQRFSPTIVHSLLLAAIALSCACAWETTRRLRTDPDERE